MKFGAKFVSVLLATGAGTAAAQDDDDYVEINWDWSGSGKIYLVEGYAEWRAQYVTAVSGIPVGCLNEDGRLVADEGDNCAVFYVDGYPGIHLRTVKNDYLCGYADYVNCIGDGYPGLTTMYTYVVPPPTYISGYVPGVDSTSLFTWFVDHTPANATDVIPLEYRLPVNPDDPTTNPPPGASTFGVVMQWFPLETSDEKK